MKIEVNTRETVEETIDRVIKEDGIEAFEYASATHRDDIARVVIGGDLLTMDVHGQWHHKGAPYLHSYFDVYINDNDGAITFWIANYNSVGSAFADAMKYAIDRVSRGF